MGRLPIQQVNDGVGVGATEAVSEERYTAGCLYRYVTEEQSRASGNGTDGRETDRRLIITDEFLLSIGHFLCLVINNELVGEQGITAGYSAC